MRGGGATRLSPVPKAQPWGGCFLQSGEQHPACTLVLGGNAGGECLGGHLVNHRGRRLLRGPLAAAAPAPAAVQAAGALWGCLTLRAQETMRPGSRPSHPCVPPPPTPVPPQSPF